MKYFGRKQQQKNLFLVISPLLFWFLFCSHLLIWKCKYCFYRVSSISWNVWLLNSFNNTFDLRASSVNLMESTLLCHHRLYLNPQFTFKSILTNVSKKMLNHSLFSMQGMMIELPLPFIIQSVLIFHFWQRLLFPALL